MNNINKKELKITIGSEYNVVVENNIDNSINKDIYLKALEHVADIIGKSSKEQYGIESNNNVIAFVGDRGSGKTSAMLSFAKLLSEGKIDSKQNTCKGNYFEDLKVIDPSLFENNNNILEVVLSRIFTEFKDFIDNPNKYIDDNEKRELLKLFEKVHRGLNTIVSDKKDILSGNSIDSLVRMSDTSKLKENIGKLIKRYTKLKSKDNDNNEKKTFLLIKIDDIDLNTKNAYEMIEQVRKYLICDNVIILMAVKLEQLSTVVEKQYFNEFEKLIKEGRMSKEEPKQMTERYLEKLIPNSRRMYLEDINVLESQVPFKIVEKIKNEEIVKYRFNNVDEGLRELIYIKTGLVFLSHKSKINYIVPRNLRELNHFVSFLYRLDDVCISAKDRIIKLFSLKENGIYSDNLKDILKELFSENIKNYNKYSDLDNFYEILKIDNSIIGIDYFLQLIMDYKDILLDDEILEITNKVNSEEKIKEIIKDNIENIKEDKDRKNKYLAYEQFDSEWEDYLNNLKDIIDVEVINKNKVNNLYDFIEEFSKELRKNILDIFKEDDEGNILFKEYKDKDKMKNIKIFENYFMKNWIFNKLSTSEYDCIIDILSVDTSERNKFGIGKLYKNIEKILKNKEDNELKNKYKDLDNVVNIFNNPKNISFGDLHLIISLAEDLDIYSDEFIFALKTVLFIDLYKRYLEHKYVLEEYRKNKENKDRDRMLITDYQRLINIEVYNGKKYKVISGKGQGSNPIPRQTFKIHKDYFKDIHNNRGNEFIKFCINKLGNGYTDKYRLGDNIVIEDRVDNRMVQNEDDSKKKGRSKVYFEFDLLSLFSNSINIEYLKSKLNGDNLNLNINFDEYRYTDFYIASIELYEKIIEFLVRNRDKYGHAIDSGHFENFLDGLLKFNYIENFKVFNLRYTIFTKLYIKNKKIKLENSTDRKIENLLEDLYKKDIIAKAFNGKQSLNDLKKKMESESITTVKDIGYYLKENLELIEEILEVTKKTYQLKEYNKLEFIYIIEFIIFINIEKYNYEYNMNTEEKVYSKIKKIHSLYQNEKDNNSNKFEFSQTQNYIKFLFELFDAIENDIVIENYKKKIMDLMYILLYDENYCEDSNELLIYEEETNSVGLDECMKNYFILNQKKNEKENRIFYELNFKNSLYKLIFEKNNLNKFDTLKSIYSIKEIEFFLEKLDKIKDKDEFLSFRELSENADIGVQIWGKLLTQNISMNELDFFSINYNFLFCNDEDNIKDYIVEDYIFNCLIKDFISQISNALDIYRELDKKINIKEISEVEYKILEEELSKKFRKINDDISF